MKEEKILLTETGEKTRERPITPDFFIVPPFLYPA